MSNAMQTMAANFGAVASVFQAYDASDDDLGAGITGGYGLIGYRGKVWSIRYKGEETQLMRSDGDGAMGSIEVVILKAPNHLSKVWYEGGWQDGSAAPPDCASTNGITPDANVPKRQSDVCATCKWDAFGSRVPVPGQPTSKGKACSDHKRLAIVPLNDLRNEMYGGPMLLRTPAASLNDLATFANKLKQMGFPYFSVGVRIAFDPAESYPKFVFKAVRPLTDDEARTIIELRSSMEVGRIIDGEARPVAPQIAAPQSQPQQDQFFEQPASPGTTHAPPSNLTNVADTPAPQPQQAKANGFGGAAPQQAQPQQAQPQVKTNGFGGVGQTVQQAQPQQAQQTAQQTATHAEPESSGIAEFDRELDATLDELLQ